jgi:phosphate starvation-inducible protein PhoH
MSRKRLRTDSSREHKIDFVLDDIEPLTINQARVLNGSGNRVLSGSAGTGKTFLAAYLGLKSVIAGKHNRLVIIRSAVATRDMGHMPGNESEKASYYERPYVSIVNELMGRGDAYAILKLKGAIGFMTTSFLRGDTITNSVVLVDEIQNMNFHELDTVITRIGKGCTVILCGDYKQRDLKDSGIKKFLEIIKTMNSFQYTEFTREDIVRSGTVKEYIIAKEIYEESSTK